MYQSNYLSRRLVSLQGYVMNHLMLVNQMSDEHYLNALEISDLFPDIVVTSVTQILHMYYC
jgi:hypothetical protein